jgi:large subunit ribosomal protein L22
MGKAKISPPRGDNEALAVGTCIRGSAQKLNLVATLIRGKKVEEAMNILAFSKRAMAVDVRKVLASRHRQRREQPQSRCRQLVVAEASVGKGLVMKRFHARGRGKSTRILKPFSRVRIVVREQNEGRRKHMGQKSNPIGLRLQINRTWDSRWFAEAR